MGCFNLVDHLNFIIDFPPYITFMEICDFNLLCSHYLEIPLNLKSLLFLQIL
jgi:hypothetical protein